MSRLPANEGRKDNIYKDERRNLVVCPLPYDGAFVETFYKAWEVVTQFLAADAQVPNEVALARPPARTVARYLADRREHPVLEVIEVLRPLSQPRLLTTEHKKANVVLSGGTSTAIQTGSILAPTPTVR